MELIILTAKCEANQFQCLNSKCLDPSAVCNGYEDCLTGEDEQNCCEYQQTLSFKAGSCENESQIKVQLCAPQFVTPSCAIFRCLSVVQFRRSITSWYSMHSSVLSSHTAICQTMCPIAHGHPLPPKNYKEVMFVSTQTKIRKHDRWSFLPLSAGQG